MDKLHLAIGNLVVERNYNFPGFKRVALALQSSRSHLILCFMIMNFENNF